MLDALEAMGKRIDALDEQIVTLMNNQQSLMKHMEELQRSNTLALARLRGTGATS